MDNNMKAIHKRSINVQKHENDQSCQQPNKANRTKCSNLQLYLK
jgi:hypothetical protein